MQSKFEEFNKLSPEIKTITAQNLSNSDLANLAQTSKCHLELFTPMLNVRKLLHHVTRGQHDEVKAMLKKDMRLIFIRGVVTDCSGREFENISGFEYALWALDKHMWAAMIECIPSDESGKEVFARLNEQYEKVNTDRVTYRLNGKTITEQHFDFNNTIIKELRTQADSRNAPGVKNLEAIDKQWREGVGGAQKQLPMHVVCEYCSNELFYPVPKFTSQPKSSKQFYNWTTEKNENWFSVDSKLSVDFAISCGDGGGRLAAGVRSLQAWAWSWRAGVDLDAMTALCEVRTKDFIDLKSQLEAQMTLAKQDASKDNGHRCSANTVPLLR